MDTSLYAHGHVIQSIQSYFGKKQGEGPGWYTGLSQELKERLLKPPDSSKRPKPISVSEENIQNTLCTLTPVLKPPTITYSNKDRHQKTLSKPDETFENDYEEGNAIIDSEEEMETEEDFDDDEEALAFGDEFNDDYGGEEIDDDAVEEKYHVPQGF